MRLESSKPKKPHKKYQKKTTTELMLEEFSTVLSTLQHNVS